MGGFWWECWGGGEALSYAGHRVNVRQKYTKTNQNHVNECQKYAKANQNLDNVFQK